jgi:nucleotide-binding universal stress UspA family protein
MSPKQQGKNTKKCITFKYKKMKLLVTTDFSANSKGAIRFAQNLAKQSKNVEVVFYHAIHFLQPTIWSNVFFAQYQEEEIERLSVELKKFIHSVIDKDKAKFADVKFVVENSISTEKDIIQYAEKNKLDFICIATQGAGMLRKVMGTHTSYMVNNSKVPVMVIPSHYRAKQIKNTVYLSDFENLKDELLKISKLSTEISSHLEVLHYSSIILNEKKFEKNKELFKTKEFENIRLNIKKNTLEFSIIERITEYIQKSKPELLVMFTNREKGFFESLFLPSKSAELTYSTKIPVLIFSK